MYSRCLLWSSFGAASKLRWSLSPLGSIRRLMFTMLYYEGLSTLAHFLNSFLDLQKDALRWHRFGNGELFRVTLHFWLKARQNTCWWRKEVGTTTWNVLLKAEWLFRKLKYILDMQIDYISARCSVYFLFFVLKRPRKIREANISLWAKY